MVLLGVDSRDRYQRKGFQNALPSKENFALYAGSLQKGQLQFAQTVDPELLHRSNLTIYFVGAGDEWQNIEAVLQARGVPYRYLGFVSDRRELAKLYIQARMILHLHVEYDPGPRVIYEALCGNTPFIVSDWVEVSQDVRQFGITLESPITTEALSRAIKKVLKTNWDDRIVSFARGYIMSLDRFISSIFVPMEDAFCAKHPDRCIEEEETKPLSLVPIVEDPNGAPEEESLAQEE